MKIDSIKLRKFREKKHLSQIELAESIGVSQATIWEWEQRDCDIKLEYFVKLIEIYGEDTNTLSKDGTVINIRNSSNIERNEVIDYNVKIDPYQLQKDYIEVLKQNNEFHRNSINQLLDKITVLINKLK
jgi:transcriptional regulator with XRE-family HTH domain